MKRLLLALALTCPFALVSCSHATTATPAPTNSPQAQVLNLDKTLADANNAAVKTAIALRNQGKMSPATTRAIEDVAVSIVGLHNAIADELTSGDSWTIQKQKIILLLAGFGLQKVTSDPALQSAFFQVLDLIGQIKMQVSQ